MPEAGLDDAQEAMHLRRRAVLASILLAITVVPAAIALDAPPSVKDFDDQAAQTDISAVYPDSGVSFLAAFSPGYEACDASVQSGGFSGPNRLAMDCQPEINVIFDQSQAYVALRARPRGVESSGSSFELTLTVLDENSAPMGRPITKTVGDGDWATFAFADAGGGPSIHVARLSTTSYYLDVDDVTHSATSQPDTEITARPPALTASRSATFNFDGNSGAAFQCRLDDAPFVACRPPRTLSDVPDGTHTFQVANVDSFGTADPSPASYTWRIDRTPPDTAITFAPAATTTSDAANFTFTSPDADVAAFECRLDGGAFGPCTSPARYSRLANGAHSFEVRARDGLGNTDASPARHEWTIQPPAAGAPREPPAEPPAELLTPPPGATTPQGAADPCAPAGQPDSDGDGIPNACETLASGALPAVAGVNAIVRALEGEVYVKLPRSAGASVLQAGPERGFIPLKGAASVPVGSTIDTRSGRASVSTAADFRKGGDRRHRTQQSTFAAGIFQVKQSRRRRRGAPARPTTDVALVSASGTESRCRGSSPSPKGVVRTLSGVLKGRYRTIGGASTTTVSNATIVVTDRCDGTLTEVGRGRASVLDRARRRTVTLRAGQAYLARARIFTAKGRRNR